MVPILVQDRPGEIRPEWVKAPPVEWETRLREISPIVDRTSHLRFRWRDQLWDAGEGKYVDCSQWWLYECIPAHLIDDPFRAEQLTVHWTNLPTDQQAGRKRFCTEYQHYMMRTHRLDVRPFWILQGSEFIVGGTPFSYTEREKAILSAEGEDAEPVPPNTLPNVPFDERAVAAIQARDRLVKAGGDLDQMEKANRPDALKAEDDATAQAHRKAVLDWHRTANKPSAEFMQWYARQKRFRHTLAPAPAGLANTLADWKDRYIETGAIQTSAPRSRLIQVAVK